MMTNHIPDNSARSIMMPLGISVTFFDEPNLDSKLLTLTLAESYGVSGNMYCTSLTDIGLGGKISSISLKEYFY